MSFSPERKAPYRKRKSLSPLQVETFLQEKKIIGYPSDISNVQISCGSTFCSAIVSDKTVVGWGSEIVNKRNQLTIPPDLTEVVQIATSIDYTVALRSDGTLVGWGNSTKPFYRTPDFRGFVKIAGNGENFLALTSDNNLVGWGSRKYFDISNYPEEVFTDSPIKDIAVGYFHASALKEDGTVVVWGDSDNNHLAVPESEYKYIEIKSYNEFTLALTEAGTLVGWGIDRYGQQNIPVELTIPYGDKVISFGVGYYHCAAITESGQIYTWGWDIQPGDKIKQSIIVGRGEVQEITLVPRDHKYMIKVPKNIFTKEDGKPVKIFTGIDTVYVLTSEGDIIGWGDDNYELLQIPEVIPALLNLEQPPIDLYKYGINTDFDSLIQNRYLPSFSMLSPIITDDNRIIKTSNNIYYKGKMIGEGAYGKVYEVLYKGKPAVVKVQRIQDGISQLVSLLTETVAQIIIQEESFRTKAEMKICPDIYEVAYDPRKNNFYIFQEKVDLTLKQYLKTRPNDKEFAEFIIDLALKMNWLYDNLEFNHRDFHSGNVMVKINPGNTIEPILIDFGFSCLTYRGIRIKPNNFYANGKCFMETRDMSLILYAIYSGYSKYLSNEMNYTLSSMLKFEVKGEVCDLGKEYCDEEEIEWDDYYDILNLSYIYNPNTTTESVIEIMSNFL